MAVMIILGALYCLSGRNCATWTSKVKVTITRYLYFSRVKDDRYDHALYVYCVALANHYFKVFGKHARIPCAWNVLACISCAGVHLIYARQITLRSAYQIS